LSVVPSPLQLGDCPSFYRPRREQFTCVPHYFPTCGSMASSVMELTAVLANPAPAEASWRVLCSYRSGYEGGGVVVGRPAVAADRFEGAVNGGPVRGTVAVVATSCPHALQQHRDVAIVPGVVRQWRVWPHRVDSDGDDRSHRPDVTAWPCIVTKKAFEGAVGPPSRARRISRTGVGATVSRSRHGPHRTAPHSGGDGLPQGVGGTAPGRDSRACQGRGVRPCSVRALNAHTRGQERGRRAFRCPHLF
jgi:hypothetical protein